MSPMTLRRCVAMCVMVLLPPAERIRLEGKAGSVYY